MLADPTVPDSMDARYDDLDEQVAEAGASAIAEITAAMEHQQAVAACGKRFLAEHVREWHGRRRSENPLGELVMWSRDELANTHGYLHGEVTA